MKTKAEILEILRKEKPELVRELWLKKTRPFRFLCARGSARRQRRGYFGEVEPQIGLGFVELADRIEDALGIRTEVVSRRAIKSRYWEIIKEDWLMSRRARPLLVEDIWEAISPCDLGLKP
jgi:hypothetical protein